MGRLRIALGVVADLASIVTMLLFLVGMGVVVIASLRNRPPGAPIDSNARRSSPPPPRAMSEPAHGRIPLLSGTEYARPGAQLALVEFGDFQCSYCARFDQSILPALKAEYIDSGRLTFVYRDFPLPTHTEALNASRAASCAQPHGKYWEMHTRLFLMRGQFSVEELLDLAKALGLNSDAFATCISAESSKTKTDTALGRLLGVSVTPTFFVGRIAENGELELKWKLLGAQPVERFREVIERIRSDGSKQ
jgi:protein-disulfide isomerase